MSTKSRGTTAGDEAMTVEERLAKLEKTVRLWRIATAALLVVSAVFGGGLGMLFFGAPSVLRAKKFEVVSGKNIAIEFTSTPEGDGLAVLNAGIGVSRVMLGTTKKGFGTVELYGGHDQRLVGIGGSGSGGQVSIYNNSGKKVVDLQSSKTNCGAILVNDFDGGYRQGISGDHH